MTVTELSEENGISVLPKGEKGRKVGAHPEGEREGGSAVEMAGAQSTRRIAAAKLAADAGETCPGHQFKAQAGLGEEEAVAGQLQGRDGVAGAVGEISEPGLDLEGDHRQTGAAAVGEAVHETDFPKAEAAEFPSPPGARPQMEAARPVKPGFVLQAAQMLKEKAFGGALGRVAKRVRQGIYFGGRKGERPFSGSGRFRRLALDGILNSNNAVLLQRPGGLLFRGKSGSFDLKSREQQGDEEEPDHALGGIPHQVRLSPCRQKNHSRENLFPGKP